MELSKSWLLFCLLFAFFAEVSSAQNQLLIDSLEKQLATEKVDSLKVLLNYKLALMNSGKSTEITRKYASEGLEIAERIGFDQGRAKVLNAFGLASRIEGKYDEAMGFFLQALEINEELNDINGICQTLNGIGVVHQRTGNHQKAFECFERVYRYRKELPDPAGVAVSLSNMGNALEQGGNHEEALVYHLQSVKTDLENGDSVSVHFSLQSIGEIYSAQHKQDQAIKYLKHALDIRNATNNRYGQAESSISLGKAFFEQGELRKARNLLQNGIRMAEEANARQLKVKGLYLLSALLQKNGEMAESRELLEKYISLKDSIFNLEKDRQRQELEAKYQIEKSEQQIELLKKEQQLQKQELEKQQLKTLFLGVGLVSLVIILYVLYRSYEKKQEMNRLLHQMNEQLSSQKDEILAQTDKLQEAHEKISFINSNLEKEIQERTRQLQETNKELDLFLYHSSHDLRRPLTTILGLAEISKLELKEGSDLFDRVSSTVRNMDKMLEKLVMLSEINNEKVTSREPENLNAIFASIKSNYAKYLIEKKIEWIEEIPAESISNLNARLLHILFQNIIENAVQFTQAKRSEPSFIKITAEKNETCLKVTITDNGEGVPASLHQKVFELFYRGSERSQGNGIGLFLVKKICKQLKADVKMESRENDFTSFTVCLPR